MYFAKQSLRGAIYQMFSTWLSDPNTTSLITNVVKIRDPILKLESHNTLLPHNA